MKQARAQSEVVGVVLMTAVIIILAMIVGGTILSTVDTEEKPTANLNVSVDASNVTVSHHGGTYLSVDEITVHLRSANTERHLLDAFQERQGDADSSFDPGETVTHTHNATALLTVFVVHDPSNTVLYNRDFDVPPPTQDTGPVAVMSTSSTVPVVGESVTVNASNSFALDGSIIGYAWDLDGDWNYERSGNSTITNTFTQPGNQTVRLRVTDNRGETNTTVTTITATYEPLPNFTYNPSAPGTGEEIQFDASDSGDSDGSIASYEWDFDSDGTVDGGGEAIRHSYSTPGRYNVTLNVTDDTGATNATTRSLLANSPPDANFTSACEGDECQFDASTTIDDGTIANYTWAFDDGNTTTTTEPVVNHTYAGSGTYNVTLIATDTFGLIATTSQTLSVDTVAPTIENVSLQDGDGNAIVTDGDSVSFSVTVSDSFSGVSTVTADASSLDAGTVTLTDRDGDGIYNATTSVGTSPTEGPQSVTITAVDNASNTASAMANTLTVDTTPPSITNFSVADESEFNFVVIYWEFIESFEVEWETTDDHLAETTVYVNRSGMVQDTYTDQSGDETYNNTRTYESSGREHTVTIVAVDEAGNEACRTVMDTADGSDPPDSAYETC
ncbi:Pilin/Flagellin, FlaG/FlaF family [Halorhabdus sp. SVX81]|uniref:PKD domain-containing protein n=1 Tax=Halorhabdus sp. SVX81 TaxID=2978283 RepID=UPI0023DA77A9|nr:PKD domain-containing protein [Halorhabdus sp. SVX81]WEL17977.1 Pilin/Flagellin, FlaG/FlaF family [Halorhabdus sp. SVX81]